MKNIVRLQDLVTIIPADITVGVIKRIHEDKVFHDISELTAQYKLAPVKCFEFNENYLGEKALVVWLQH